MELDVKKLADMSKFEFTPEEYVKVEKEISEILNSLLPVNERTAEQIIEAAVTASNMARYDGVRFAPTADDAKTIEELYYKTRTKHFDWQAKIQIMLGNFFMSKGNYEEYYLKAKEVAKIKTKIVSISSLREDIVKPSLSREEIMKNAPKSDGEYFIVPKVVE